MNIRHAPSKRVVLTALAAVAVLVIGGTAWAASADDLHGSERDRVATAATDAVGGTAVEVETSDDPGEAYEVEVRQADGSEVDVDLDSDLAVVGQHRDNDGNDDRDDDRNARALTPAERASAERAALAAVKGGTVLEVETSDDPGEAYEVEVRGADGTEWDVELDAAFKVLHADLDD